MDRNKILSDYDYQKFRQGDIRSWSGQKLSQFLIWDFSNVFGKMIMGKSVPESIIKDSDIFVKKYKKYLFFFNCFDKIFQKLMLFFKPLKSNKIILFQKLKTDLIIYEAKKHYFVGLIVQGRKDRLFAVKNFISYMGTTDLYLCVNNYLKDGNTKHLYELISKTENKLKIIKPDYIVLGLDSLPIDRAVIWAAKKLGIPTLVVQHGLEDSHMSLFDYKEADYILVWGEYFKYLYVKQVARRPEDIYISGYPYLIDKNYENKISDNLTLCYLGQNYEKYNKDLLKIKLETIKQLSLACKKAKLKFIYRPHPGDDRELLKERLLGICFSPKEEIIEDTFKKANIFVSSCSTSLVESSMRGKISLQLMNYPVESDNFEELGACHKSFKTITELEKYLEKISNSANLEEFKTNFNNNYIETRYNSGERFLEILEAINKKEKIIRLNKI
jgi:hypothetical protein